MRKLTEKKQYELKNCCTACIRISVEVVVESAAKKSGKKNLTMLYE